MAKPITIINEVGVLEVVDLDTGGGIIMSPATIPCGHRGMAVKPIITPIPPIPPVKPQWSMGYWNTVAPYCPMVDMTWSGLTHVIHWAATVLSDGTLNLSNLSSRTFTTDAQELIAAAHAQGVKVVLGLAQGDYTNAVNLHRPALVANIMNIVNQYGYDGVDLDWEGGTVNVGQLANDLRVALGPTRSLTAAAIVTGYNYWGTVQSPFDRINVMTYDMYETSPSVWFNSALNGPATDAVWSVELAKRRYLAGGVPASKLGIGLAFYGQYWPNITSPTQPAPNPSQMRYTSIAPLVPQRQYSYDFLARVPTISQPGLISYDNEQSLTEKVQYVKNNALGGWVIWNINMGYFPSAPVKNPLLSAIAAAR